MMAIKLLRYSKSYEIDAKASVQFDGKTWARQN